MIVRVATKVAEASKPTRPRGRGGCSASGRSVNRRRRWQGRSKHILSANNACSEQACESCVDEKVEFQLEVAGWRPRLSSSCVTSPASTRTLARMRAASMCGTRARGSNKQQYMTGQQFRQRRSLNARGVEGKDVMGSVVRLRANQVRRGNRFSQG